MDPHAHDPPGDPQDPPRPQPARRSLVAFAMLAAGYAIAREVPAVPAPAWFGLAAAALALAALTRARPAKVALAAAALLAGAGWFALRIHESPRAHLAELAPSAEPVRDGPPLLLTVEGMVVEPPHLHDPARGVGELARFTAAGQPPRWRITVDVDRLISPTGPISATGRLRIWLPHSRDDPAPPKPPAHAGDRIRASGEFEPISPPLNPGAPDRLLLAAQEGSAGSLRVPAPALLERLEPPTNPAWAARSLWRRALASLRAGALRALDAAVTEGRADAASPEARAMLAALLLGEYDAAAQDVASAFTRQGLVHLIAISGFHLVCMAYAALVLVRLTGERGWVEPAIVAALVVLYMLIVPAQTPVIRAGLMVLTLLAAEAAGRRYDRLTILGWIAVALALWRPMDLWSLGFQLSFGVVAVLLWLGTHWHGRLWGVPLRGVIRTPPRTPAGMLLRAGVNQFKGLTAASILCWAVSAPLIAHHTGIVSPIAALTGVLIVPLVTLVLWLGYIALALGAAWPAASGAVGWSLERLAALTAATVRWLDHIPGTVLWLPSVSAAWAAAASATILYWFARGHTRDRRAWGLTALLAAWLAAEVLLAPALRWRGDVRVDALAVGDGTCILVRAGRGVDGEDAMLWDCGSLRAGLGVRELPRALRALGAWKVRTAVITHAHLDHFSALPDVAGPLGIRRILISEPMAAMLQRHPRSAAAAMVELLQSRGIEVRTIRIGETFQIGSATMEVLWPDDALIDLPLSRANETSLVAAITPPSGPRILLTGDIGPLALAALAEHPGRIRAGVLELPHHGSVNPQALDFVAASDPGVILQSTGRRRAGDPRWDPLRPGRTWLTTATDGAAWAEVHRDGRIVAGAYRIPPAPPTPRAPR